MEQPDNIMQVLPGTITIINLVILMFVVFFFTSTLASHLLEAFVGFINSRGKQLRERLGASLGDDVAASIYASPLISSLAADGKGDAKHAPSYLEPEFFARAVVRLFKEDGSKVSQHQLFKDLSAEARENGVTFEAKIIEWFKALNERQNGTYTRWSFLRLAIIGLLLAALMDIDTVQIAGTLWKKPEAVEALVSKLETDVPALKSADAANLSEDDRKKLGNAIAGAWAGIRSEAPVLYGWKHTPSDATGWFSKVLGWLLTALATSLGAQFWFNLLSEALKLRATGRKPDSEPKKNEQMENTGQIPKNSKDKNATEISVPNLGDT